MNKDFVFEQELTARLLRPSRHERLDAVFARSKAFYNFTGNEEKKKEEEMKGGGREYYYSCYT